MVDPTVAAGPAWSLPGHWRPAAPSAARRAPTSPRRRAPPSPPRPSTTPRRRTRCGSRSTATSPRGLTADDVTVRDLSTGSPVTPHRFAYDPATRTATLTFDGGLPNGDWRATVPANATAGPAPAGPLPQDFVLSFFTLAGDVNRDRAVNGTDFAILAGNFGRTGMTYAQGDLNGDGTRQRHRLRDPRRQLRPHPPRHAARGVVRADRRRPGARGRLNTARPGEAAGAGSSPHAAPSHRPAAGTAPNPVRRQINRR